MLLFILPFMVSEIIRIFTLRPILSRHGLINNFLMDFNFIDSPISAFVFTPTGVVIGEIVSFLPFMIFSTFLALEAIPNYVFEVCADLGVNRRRMFKDIQEPFMKSCPKDRKNFLSYSYVLYKFVELLQMNELKQYFPLLKSREKLHLQDLIWRDICKLLEWPFYKSI